MSYGPKAIALVEILKEHNALESFVEQCTDARRCFEQLDGPHPDHCCNSHSGGFFWSESNEGASPWIEVNSKFLSLMRKRGLHT